MEGDMLRELYQEVILDHNRNPRHFHELPKANRSADGYNPLCGDKMQLRLLVNTDDIIEQAAFTGKGCAISTASASLMVERLPGLPISKALALFETMHALLTESPTVSDIDDDLIGKLTVLAGVKAYPARVKCATLAWHTLNNALANKIEIATTE